MLENPHITQTDVQLTAAIRLTIKREEIRNVMGPGITELMTTVAVQGIGPAGPWLTHHLRMDPEIFDFEICVPVTAAVTPVGRVAPSQLPAARVARAIYIGPYEGLSDAWREFDEWMQANGHVGGSELWEVYVAGPETGPDSSKFRTELNHPLES
ncbi:MAG TPA: GyrI-like domain-containing protein [Gemmataceae bacterium]|nr:GyrI-like domain-containing protein [Gemmataceae bacterium]